MKMLLHPTFLFRILTNKSVLLDFNIHPYIGGVGVSCGVAGRATACEASVHMGSVPAAALLISSLLIAWERKQKMVPKCWDPCNSCGETQMKLLAPGFSLTQPWPLWPFGEEPVNGRSLALSVSPSLLVILSNK